MVDAELSQHLQTALVALWSSHFLNAITDILLHSQMREKSKALKDVSKSPVSSRNIQPAARTEHHMRVNGNESRCRRFDSGNAVENGGLAGPRGSEEHRKTWGNIEDAVELEVGGQSQPDFGRKCVHAFRGLDHQIELRRFSP